MCFQGNSKKKKKGSVSGLFLILILFAVLIAIVDLPEAVRRHLAGAVETAVSQDTGGGEEREGGEDGTLKLTMLDVGQGLCLLVQSGGETMIYDGGGRKSSSYVVSYLKSHEVETVKYLIASHYDEDHIAGLVGVLSAFQVETAILPDYEADTAIYSSLLSAAENAGERRYAKAGDVFEIGDANAEVLYACSGEEEKENDKSTVVRLSIGDFSCMITGDAERETEVKLVQSKKDLSCQVYVVGHHGSASSSTPEFVSSISPDIALISVGKDNEYGHPAERTLETLERYGVKIYRTDQNGEIVVQADASGRYSVDVEKEPGEKEEEKGEETEGFGYILNTYSWKFHLPGCPSVLEMADHNRAFSDVSREELIEMGYSPCGRCKP